MKTLCISLALASMLMTTQLRAQLGVQAGPVGIFGESFPTADGLSELGGAMGYTVGAFYNFRLSSNFILQPAVNLLNKQWKDDLDDGIDQVITKVSINYLEVPIQFVYKQQKASGFFVGAGPSFNVGLSGKQTVDTNGSTTSTSVEFENENYPEKSFTITVNVMAGYSFRKFMLSLNYSQGLTNQPAEDAYHGNVNHLALRIGYIFGLN